MKIRSLVGLFLVLLLVAVFAACDIAEDAVEDYFDSVEDSIEDRIENKGDNQGSLTQEDAETIALDHAGLTAGDVSGLRTEYDRDNGVSRYEVHFYQGYVEYEYDINAETGEILSFEKDDR